MMDREQELKERCDHLGKRVVAIEARLAALEARCHELKVVPEQIADLQERVKAVLENERGETASRWWSETRQAPSPVDDHRDKERPPVQPPELVRCEVIGCTHTSCGHLDAHWKEPLCSLRCSRFKSVRCIPVPASPEVAIPDVPVAVGTEAFQARLRGHIQELGGAYSWGAGHPVEWMDDYLERLAGVACTLRDAYELARTGEHVAAQEKLEEISW